MVQMHLKNCTLGAVKNLFGQSADQIVKDLLAVQNFFCLLMKDLEHATESALAESANGTKSETRRITLESMMFL